MLPIARWQLLADLTHVPHTETAQSVAIATHVSTVPGPAHQLRDYCVKRAKRVALAEHPFSYTGKCHSTLFYFCDGKEVSKKTFSFPLAFALVRDVMANFVWFSLNASDIFVGIDNLNAACAIVLRALGRTKQVVYYVIDYTPRRFKNRFANSVYHAIDAFAVRFSDEVWNISPRIAEIRRAQGVAEQRNKVVPIGVVQSDLPPQDLNRDRNALVVLSHLVEDKGVQLIIEAMPLIRRDIPDATLRIIGSGPFETSLRRLTADLGLQQTVQFLGQLDYVQLYRVMSSSGIGVAAYKEMEQGITYYADPGKPKDYLACGLPVIITDVPAVAREIRDRPMGLVVRYQKDDVTRAAVQLMRDTEFYDRCSKNARDFIRDLDWSLVFSRAFGNVALKR